MTPLASVDLNDDLWGRVLCVQNLKDHPYGFYLKLGFRIIGVRLVANGLGKPTPPGKRYRLEMAALCFTFVGII